MSDLGHRPEPQGTRPFRLDVPLHELLMKPASPAPVPLLRPNFIHKVIYYAAKNDMLVYVPTNGRLLRPDVIDKLGDAGMGTVNLAVDCIEEKPGLEKALAPIRPYFEYLLKRMHYYGYTVFLNVCITRTNMDDVKELAAIARANNL